VSTGKAKRKNVLKAAASPDIWLQLPNRRPDHLPQARIARSRFEKRRQRFICAYNEALSVALHINNENRAKASDSPLAPPAKK